MFSGISPVASGSRRSEQWIVVACRERASSVTSAHDAGRLDEERVYLPLGDGAVFDTPRHDEELTRSQRHIAVPQLDGQLPVHHQEKFVGLLMGVPHEFTL